MIVPCDHCSKPVKAQAHKLKKFKHTFCSRDCYAKWMSETRQSPSKPCMTCGKPVTRVPSKLKGNVYCSRECSRQAQFRTETRACENCGKSVTRVACHFRRHEHIYCSIQCCNKSRKGKPHPDPEHGKKMRELYKGQKPSPQCLAAVSKANSGRLRDPKVQAKMQAGVRKYYETHPGPNKDRYSSLNYNWRGGIAFEPYSEEFNSVLKATVRTRDSHQCQLCEMSEAQHWLEHFSLLLVHHIDYNKQNSDISNLITLCKKCHGKTNGSREYYTQMLSRLVISRSECIVQLRLL